MALRFPSQSSLSVFLPKASGIGETQRPRGEAGTPSVFTCKHQSELQERGVIERGQVSNWTSLPHSLVHTHRGHPMFLTQRAWVKARVPDKVHIQGSLVSQVQPDWIAGMEFGLPALPWPSPRCCRHLGMWTKQVEEFRLFQINK